MEVTDELSCEVLVELLSDFIERTLTEESRRICDSHLAQCLPCTDYLRGLRYSIAVSGRLRGI